MLSCSPIPDWFDHSAVRKVCDSNPDKAIIVGHEGPFQMVTFLIEMDQFFMLMLDEPDTAKRILERMNEFEMEYYRRIFEAGRAGWMSFVLMMITEHRYPCCFRWICG